MRTRLLLTAVFVLLLTGVSFARVIKEYYPDGKIYYIQVVGENGEVKGPYRQYYPNGRLREKIWYKDGQQYITKRWTIDGKLLSTVGPGA